MHFFHHQSSNHNNFITQQPVWTRSSRPVPCLPTTMHLSQFYMLSSSSLYLSRGHRLWHCIDCYNSNILVSYTITRWIWYLCEMTQAISYGNVQATWRSGGGVPGCKDDKLVQTGRLDMKAKSSLRQNPFTSVGQKVHIHSHNNGPTSPSDPQNDRQEKDKKEQGQVYPAGECIQNKGPRLKH